MLAIADYYLQSGRADDTRLTLHRALDVLHGSPSEKGLVMRAELAVVWESTGDQERDRF